MEIEKTISKTEKHELHLSNDILQSAIKRACKVKETDANVSITFSDKGEGGLMTATVTFTRKIKPRAKKTA